MTVMSVAFVALVLDAAVCLPRWVCLRCLHLLLFRDPKYPSVPGFILIEVCSVTMGDFQVFWGAKASNFSEL